MSESGPETVIDTRGLNCPLPVLKTKRAIEGLQPGQVLKVMASDRSAEQDISELLNRMGHEMLEVKDTGSGIEFYIRKN